MNYWFYVKKKGAQNVLNYDITRDGLNGEKILGALSLFCFIIDHMKLWACNNQLKAIWSSSSDARQGADVPICCSCILSCQIMEIMQLLISWQKSLMRMIPINLLVLYGWKVCSGNYFFRVAHFPNYLLIIKKLVSADCSVIFFLELLTYILSLHQSSRTKYS